MLIQHGGHVDERLLCRGELAVERLVGLLHLRVHFDFQGLVSVRQNRPHLWIEQGAKKQRGQTQDLGLDPFLLANFIVVVFQDVDDLTEPERLSPDQVPPVTSK